MLITICFFTALIHFTETIVYGMRLAGLRTRQIAIAMSFVTSSLLISRLSNMFQAPLLGAMVDKAVLSNSPTALPDLEFQFRLIIFSGALGIILAMGLTPSIVQFFQVAIRDFLRHGSLPKVIIKPLWPTNWKKNIRLMKWPRLAMLKPIRLGNIPRTFLVMNVAVTSIYTIGVLCALLAGAYLPHFRATAIQLSGIVNGIATILLTLFVDPSGARITDQATHQSRSHNDVRSVVFFLQMGKLLGVLIVAQIMLKPFTEYIIWVTQWIARFY